MQQRFQFQPSQASSQQVFRFQDKALASLERRTAQNILKVFDQAYANRLWSYVPMLPERPPVGWRADKEGRRDLQNTFQLNALAVDMDITRDELARVPSFRAFQRRALAAARFFDLRIGPPWWISDKDFLESAYVASQEQEKPDPYMNESLFCYWGDCADTPYWVAQCFFDNLHADEVGLPLRGRGASKEWSNEEYRANVLLNWQTAVQPLLAYSPDDERVRLPWSATFPHQFELKRMIRLLNLKPRVRPERNLHAVPSRSAAAGRAPAAPRHPHHQIAHG